MNNTISFTATVKDCMKTMRSPRVFYPFFFYALFQLLIVAAIAYFAYPPFSSVLVPLFKKYFGEQALHYPNNYVLLNPLFEWTNIFLSGLIGVLVIGSGTLIFVSHYQNKPPSFAKSLRLTGSKYLKLLGVWFFETSVLLTVLIGLPYLLSSQAQANSKIIQAVSWLTPIFAVLVGAVFAYTTAVIVIDNRGVFTAIKNSFSIFLDHPVFSYALIGIPAFFVLPLELLKSKSPLLVTKFFPEVVLALVVIGIVISVLASCWVVGTVTRFYLSLTKNT
ncbi:MAG: hypothetical protein ACE5IR_18060 [bacterium]